MKKNGDSRDIFCEKLRQVFDQLQHENITRFKHKIRQKTSFLTNIWEHEFAWN